LKKFPHASDVNREQMSLAARQTASMVRADYLRNCALRFKNAFRSGAGREHVSAGDRRPDGSQRPWRCDGG
jgi:hypothetical protein